MTRRALALAAVLAPGLARACAACARDEVPWVGLLVAGMIAAPYVVAAVVIRAIRAGGGEP